MPTENRSSNTQAGEKMSPCPFCGQQDAFVEQLDSDASVVICQGRIDEHSACLARGPVGVKQHECEDQPGHDQAVKEWNKRAAAQHHPEPIAWMVGTAIWWSKAQAERDSREVGEPVAALGPLADPGEVERLRERVSAYKASRERLHEWLREEQLKNIALRAQLDEALRVASQAHMALLGYLPGHRNDVTTAAIEACAALSASDVPSAPVECAICRDLGGQCMECEEAEFREWADRHFASADYRKTAAGVFIQDWMRHAYAAWCARAALARKA